VRLTSSVCGGTFTSLSVCVPFCFNVIAALLIPALPAHADTISTFTLGTAWDDTSGNALQNH
jgi:hypothetical protein